MKQAEKNISKKEALLRLQNLCGRAEKSEFEIQRAFQPV